MVTSIMARPNILLVITDQQRAGALSAAGNPRGSPPAMDSTPAQALPSPNNYSPPPLCCPPRASLQTGRMAHATGVTTNHLSIKPGIPQLGPWFRQAGYETAWVGKWHLPQEYPLEPDAITGFDNLPLTRRLLDKGGYPLRIEGLPGAWEHNLGSYADPPVARAAADFLRQPHSKPFFLTVSLMNPHDLCFPDQHHRAGDPVRAELPPLPANFEPCDDEPEYIGKKGWKGARQWPEEKWR